MVREGAAARRDSIAQVTTKAPDPPVDTRDALLRATLAVIAEYGVAGLTNRRIATHAAVSLGSLTYHFASQTELLREAMVLFVTDETTRINALVRALARTVRSVPDAASAAQQALAEWAVGRAEIAQLELYVQAARDPELHAATATCFAAYDEVATTILTLLAVPDPARRARHVVALICGAQLRRLATGTDQTADIGDGLLLLAGGTVPG